MSSSLRYAHAFTRMSLIQLEEILDKECCRLKLMEQQFQVAENLELLTAAKSDTWRQYLQVQQNLVHQLEAAVASCRSDFRKTKRRPYVSF